jgi:hypothetical protein
VIDWREMLSPELQSARGMACKPMELGSAPNMAESGRLSRLTV